MAGGMKTGEAVEEKDLNLVSKTSENCVETVRYCIRRVTKYQRIAWRQCATICKESQNIRELYGDNALQYAKSHKVSQNCVETMLYSMRRVTKYQRIAWRQCSTVCEESQNLGGNMYQNWLADRFRK
jgi:hypothetical protein